MYSKDRREYSVVKNLSKELLKEFGELEKLYKQYAKKTYGNGTAAFIEPDNYGKDRYRFTIRFVNAQIFPKEIENSLAYLVKWAITDTKMAVLKRNSLMYGFFASKHKVIV